MSREIKFRAWDSQNKQMFQIHSLSTEDSNADRLRFKVHEMEFPIMQYTGLLDKNGKEIYEGDIIKGIVGIAEGFFFEVGFENGCFIAKVPWIDGKEQSYPELKYYVDMTFVEIEVTGNIYESKELLEH